MMKLMCSGWWEQQGYGRQPMDELILEFDGGQVRGVGTDVVGDFALYGNIDQSGIRLTKQYLGQHQIEYLGTYDGEGVYYGRWNYAGFLGGNWLIRLASFDHIGPDAPIAEIS